MDSTPYYSSLDNVHRQRYRDKISAIGIDPYSLETEELSTDISLFPKVMYPDIVNYLVETKSAFTMNEMKAYKSLEAYNMAICGWVRRFGVKQINSHILVIGKVMHSQRLNDKLLTPWIICFQDGNIISAHCDCTAGLGEVCSHVAAVLFSIDHITRKQEEVTLTGRKAYWMPPTNKPAEPCRVLDLNLVNPKRMNLTEDDPIYKREAASSDISPVSEEEKQNLLMSLVESKGAVLHSIIRPFAESLAEKINSKKKFIIMNLYRDEYDHLTLLELQELGEMVDISITIEECRQIEKETREQSKCKSWYNYRAGRVTASNFKKCCRTKIEKPSISLIKSMCYPVTHRLKIRAMDYGCQHEKLVKEDFLKELGKTHHNIQSDPMGFFINPCYPYFGASPDGMVTCDCCGTCAIEVKCPYCARFTGLTNLIHKDTYMIERNGTLSLKEDHEYYFQVQMQLALTGLKSCFFIVWSKKDFAYCSVPFNGEFWERESSKAKDFFFKVILPEALGKYFTKTQQGPSKTVLFDPQPGPSKPIPALYCLCQQEDDKCSPMIACESGHCEIESYHFSCVGITDFPAEKWICDFCKDSEN